LISEGTRIRGHTAGVPGTRPPRHFKEVSMSRSSHSERTSRDVVKALGTVAALSVLCLAGTTSSVLGDPTQPSPAGVPNNAPSAPATPQPDQIPTLDQIRQLMGGGGGGPPGADEGDGLRPFAEVAKGFEPVGSSDNNEFFFRLHQRKRDNALLAELPRGWESQRHFIALTVASGETYAGLQAGDLYGYWKRTNNRLMFITPQIDTRSTGDRESRDSVKRLFTDRVVLDVAILATGPNGQPVIDAKDLLVGRAGTFFGWSASGINARLAEFKTLKIFGENVEISFEAPTADGTIKEYHYSISVLKGSPSFQPRVADERLGYFTTTWRDLGKFTDKEKWVRYINRWHLEKRDSKLKLSPPKEPIVFYIENTVPVRYRRWVKDGILAWNAAYEKIGIKDAIEVYQQDAETGAHMDKDPENVKYNFIRWLSNDIGTAIGPSRVNPNTGEILDADIILTDGWIRHFWMNYKEILPEMAMEGMSPETLSWLETRPQWDPRFRLAAPEKRNEMLSQRVRRGIQAYGGHAMAAAAKRDSGAMMGDNEFDGLANRNSQMNGLCMAAQGMAFQLSSSLMLFEILEDVIEENALNSGLFLDDKTDEEELKKLLDSLPPELRALVEAKIKEMGGMEAIKAMIPAEKLAEMKAKMEKKDEPKSEDEPKKDEDKKDDKSKEKKEKNYDELDGVPDWFIGPLLADLTAHEVGHTLGLRHNFKGSSIYTMSEINSPEVKGKKNWSSSVMDYNPININMGDGAVQGDFAQLGSIGTYDFWVIEYGYGFGDPKEVLKRVGEPGHAYATDEDTSGPDPLARRYDLSKEPLDYANSSMRLAKFHRERLLDKFVKDGDSWSRARRGYDLTLGMQMRSVGMMANWVGGVFTSRDKKGDPNARPPMTVVPAAQQRAALKFVIENSFRDEAFGLTPELLNKMLTDKWMDWGGWGEAMGESTFPVHDRIAGMQASALTMIMNPTTLRRVFDNEARVPSDQDTITLPEVMGSVTDEIFSELNKSVAQRYTARQPMISSLRRNLQREMIERLIDLTLPGAGNSAAFKPLSNLATKRLRDLKDQMGKVIDSGKDNLDAYTLAHLGEAKLRIEKALDADFLYNMPNLSFDLGSFFMFGQPTGAAPAGGAAAVGGRRESVAPYPAGQQPEPGR
jgi:hypothetical protein